MRVEDIRKAITKLLHEKLGLKIFYEDMNFKERPSLYIELVDYTKEFNTSYREKKTLDFDILYFSKDKEGKNTEIYNMLENIDEAFEEEGNKIINVLDRALKLEDSFINIVDKVGHYQFSISLYDMYGKPVDYELMKELKLNF